MELMASESSALLDLSMQQESIHCHTVSKVLKLPDSFYIDSRKPTYGVLPAFFQRLGAATHNLCPSSHLRPSALLQVLESDFVDAPSVRKNGIIRDVSPIELMELDRCCVEQAHD